MDFTLIGNIDIPAMTEDQMDYMFKTYDMIDRIRCVCVQ